MRAPITTFTTPLRGATRPLCRGCLLLSLRTATVNFTQPRNAIRPAIRHYATGRAAQLSARGSQRSTERLVFSPGDVPPLEFWQRAIKSWALDEAEMQGMTAEDCMNAARRYVAIVTQRESSWRPTLEKDHGLTPRKLHVVGGLLLQGSAPAQWRLGTHMLSSASELGHAPSTVTLASFAARSAQAPESLLFRRAQARLDDLVRDCRRGPGPDALTLRGMILAARGQDAAALRAFADAERQAVESAEGDAVAEGSGGAEDDVLRKEGPRPKRWQWEASCMLGRARVLLRMGRRAEAEAALRTAAAELDSPEGCLELARVLPAESPEREAYLAKAAVSGLAEASAELAKMEEAKAQEVGAEERAEHERWAEEWRLLAS
ncbi:hypothetical protein NKR23_g9224 [Pleurostoma richardsiae]|uniref:Uncharacterized protein n=1 Tax=Pleurostoma richardsiae TaxID=41990 RepID=A0AA38VCC5_9PEZI|nr:hypothetical protein NKR23_g9224 [Pleurostoma richardsiae]